MRKNILIIALLFGFSLQAFSQYNEARRIDSTRLDSLKRILPILKDEARVNALNEIAIRSLYFNSAVDLAREDSVRLYGSKAYEEASRLGYKTGIALALLDLSFLATWAGRHEEAVRLAGAVSPISPIISSANMRAFVCPGAIRMDSGPISN